MERAELRSFLIQVLRDEQTPTTLAGALNQCMSEVGSEYNLNKHKSKASLVASWLKGLGGPSSLPFKAYDISQLMYAMGYEVRGLTIAEVEDLYYQEVGEIIAESDDTSILIA